MKIAVIGTGHVGLVTGTCFAECGHAVACADVDARKIAALRAGALPFHEPGLEELVRRNARERRLHFTTSVDDAMQGAAVAFLAVGTPADADGHVDVSPVLAAAAQVGRAMTRDAVIANRSTVPVGTTEKLAEVLATTAAHGFDVVANPEFLKEGTAVDDFTRPDRIVVGASSDRARAVMGDLYAPFVRVDRPILLMDPRSAELAKLAANAMLAARISFMNDVAALCEKLGADVDEVRRGLGADHRFGPTFLFAGAGFGGSCLPASARALAALQRDHGLDDGLLAAVSRTNERQKRLLFDKALKHFGGSVAGKRCAVWGLAFKPKTDDLREAPSLTLVQLLAGAGAEVTCHDPVAAEVARPLLGGHVRLAEEPYAAAEGADALFVVTEWNEFRMPDYERLAAVMRGRALFDGRNVWDPAKARAAGFTYHGVGRPNG